MHEEHNSNFCDWLISPCHIRDREGCEAIVKILKKIIRRIIFLFNIRHRLAKVVVRCNKMYKLCKVSLMICDSIYSTIVRHLFQYILESTLY